MGAITLYRPVGIKELELIAASGWKSFPPRLFWQPIFYPVLNEQYAIEIADGWNIFDEASGYCGIVTAFDLNDAYYANYKVQNVGGNIHNELWVPAEELELFNQHIIGTIRVVSVFFGERFEMPADEKLAALLDKYKTADKR